MKREEAIKLIDTHTVCFYNEIDSPTLQALHLAIEALQTEDKPSKVIAEVKVDTDEIVKRIKEEYVFTNEVIRCKDCRYRKKVGTSYYCELDEFNVKDEDFCSWGERSVEE